MKQYIIILFALLAFTACDEFTNSAEPSEETFFPLMKVEGGDVVLSCNATSYTDAGCVALEGGEEIEVETVSTGLYFGGEWDGNADGLFFLGHWEYSHAAPNNPDLYEISYSATNVDGIPASAGRSVHWPECNGDLVSSIAGVYKMSVRRNGVTGGLPVDDNGPFYIVDLGSNKYALSDGMGGWYEHGRGFGPHDGPALGMTITANNIATNSFTYGPAFSQPVFGGPVNITAFTVNPGTKTINFTTTWDSDATPGVNFTFTVTLTQCPDGVACWE